MAKSKWILCLCGKDVHYLDYPRHFLTKHEWPTNEDPGTKESETETADEAGSGAQTTA